jgi:hypothetical protein
MWKAPLFIEVSVSIQETERSYDCVLGVSMFIEVCIHPGN